MEEILASIRRIISDEEPKAGAAPRIVAAAAQAPAVRPMESRERAVESEPPAPPTAPRPETKPAPVNDILDLTEQMAEPAPPAPAPEFRMIDAAQDVVFAEGGSHADESADKHSAPHQPEPAQDRSLMSPPTIAAVDSAFNTLAQTVLVQNARTLEDLVKEMLRPMLKSWLDDNLPGLVERLVRAEIERVSRGRTP
jgi:cell pole-organizing protein PopZ